MDIKLVNNNLLDHVDLSDYDPQLRQDLELTSYLTRWARGCMIQPLRGANATPIKAFDHAGLFEYEVADWNPDFSMTWAEITDLKAQELWQVSRKLNRPVVLRWSGGIDSTVVLIALLKNAEPGDLDRLIVATTKTAVWESSYIYFNFIANKVKTVDFDQFIPQLDSVTFQQYLHVSGSPVDQLMIGMIGMSEPAMQDSAWFDIPWKNTKKLSEYLDQVVQNRTHFLSMVNETNLTKKFITKLLVTNIESLNLPIISVHQFVWWLNFNFFTVAQGTHEYTHWHANSGMPPSAWTSCVFPWFYDTRYQQWAMAMSSRPDILFYQGQWKWPLKQYIHDFVKDPYFLMYKTKMGSFGRVTHPGVAKKWFAIVQDQVITADNLDFCKTILNESINHTSH